MVLVTNLETEKGEGTEGEDLFYAGRRRRKLLYF
jgi:hypothetical protein